MYLPLMFHWNNQMLKQRSFHAMKLLPRMVMLAMGQHNGLLESVLVLMTCRAVRYFLPCDLDLSEDKKIMKVPLEYGN